MCGISFRCVSFTMRNVIFVLSWNITRLYRFCLMYQKLMKVSVCENLIFAMRKFHTIQKELKFIYIFGDVSINQRWNQYEVEMSKQYNIDLEFFDTKFIFYAYYSKGGVDISKPRMKLRFQSGFEVRRGSRIRRKKAWTFHLYPRTFSSD